MRSSNREASTKQKELPVDRIDILSRLWENAEWLKSRIDKTQLKLNNALRQRVYMVQVHSGVCKVLLYGLRDREIDELAEEIEKIKKHLEMDT